MIGIKSIGIHIAHDRVANISKQFGAQLSLDFLENKLGIVAVARKKPLEKASDLCVLSVQDLALRDAQFDLSQVDFISVCTQNGDYQLPQTSAIVQGKLGVSSNCAAFDISLGCSGYIYSLQVAKSFMETNGLKYGLVFTCDPYSEIIDPTDKDTDLIFGDGAAVTLLTDDPIFEIGLGAYYTDGSSYGSLIKRPDHGLYMNGRGIFDFAMRQVPPVVGRCLEANAVNMDAVDVALLHQGSKYVVENVARRMKINPAKVPIDIREYGNTVSSSIPILLQPYLSVANVKTILACGFGVGLSIAATILRRREK